ncbi:MAG: signal transduction histidine-protein kinase BaeS [Sphingomonas bacterium]|uniref:ATP-binding protein n=1 Tax=Sphingomonas bacterium TaxID=1895847 RepID=UPI00261CE3A9|nr:ATP-binding protein [Sphingomonas bacterium]MDB5706887.1 signal transduction histidine-protein kinase BaeS [Sphingomonas bacterium]
MRLFAGLFLLLAGQALLAAVLPGAVLVWNLDRGNDALMEAQDRQALAAMTTLLSAELKGGVPLGNALQAAQAGFGDNSRAGDPAPPLLGRLALFTPAGTQLSGPSTEGQLIRDERPVKVDGNIVAVAKIVRPPSASAASFAFVRDQVIGIVAAMSAIFLILLVAGYSIASRWTQPQLALFRASRAVAQGDYDTDVSETGPSETRATMRNLGRIARSFDRLETARRTWLVSVSEELRKPVHALGQRLASIAKDSPPTDPEAFEEVVEGVRRLGEMAEDLHAVALADLGRLPVTFATVDPRALIHNAIWTSAKRAQAQRVTLEPGNLPQATVPVKWDGARIEQLFTALIENSLRYTPAGGRIQLGLEGQRNAWRLIIDDSAPGVDIGLAQQLFEPFYRTTTEPGESVMSSGLGLATAQAIVEAHHGRIEASRSPIGGLRVTVILPAAPPTA